MKSLKTKSPLTMRGSSSIFVTILLGSLPLFILVLVSFSGYAQTSKATTVIELFTSQGCSSCPAADDLLNKLVEENEDIIALSFHVSYWNYLGWKDPYSSEQFTERQRTYASVKNTNSIYTPQMIVDGREEFVGSDKKMLTKSIEASKTRKATYNISATVSIEKAVIKVNYNTGKGVNNEDINLALVEKYNENYVPRGENKGLTLKHHNVVRKFVTQTLEKSGVISLSIPANFDIRKSFLVLYIQNKGLQTKGAVKVNL